MPGLHDEAQGAVKLSSVTVKRSEIQLELALILLS